MKNIVALRYLLPRFKTHAALLLLATAAVAGGWLLLVLPAKASPPAQQPPTEKPSTSGGQALWSENCQPCHGAAGKGDGPTAASLPNPPANLTDPEKARNYVPVEIFDVIKNGRMDKMMPPWKERLNDAQIWDAAAYVWRLGTGTEQLTAGEQIYTEQCAACHGNDGSGNGPQASAGINNFADLQAMTQVSQAGLFEAYNASDQHTDLSALSEDDIWASLAYARSFSFALPARNGVLTGQVINAATGQPVPNIEVALHAFQNGTPIDSLTGQADENGVFRFDKLSTEHAVFYVVEGLYENIAYVSQEPGMFLPDSNEITVNLDVYDTTTSDAAIGVSQLHYLMSFAPGMINVLQIYIVGNEGDKTFVGENGQTFAFTLPANAQNVQFQNDTGQRFIETGDGYADTEPVMPGEEGLTIAAIYDIPIDGDEATIEFPLSANVASLDVMMTEQGATLTSPQVDFVESRDFQGNSFAVFNKKNVSKGETISLNLSGLDDLEFSAAPAATVPGATISADTSWFDQQLAKWIILGVGVVAIVVAAVVYPKTRPQLTHQTTPTSDDPEIRRQKLLLTLARLDEVFENGELDDDIYARARAKYKAELADLLEMAG